MDAETQHALTIVWGLFWMFALTLVTVHPMFRPTRILIRRSLRLRLQQWATLKKRQRARMLRLQGGLRIVFGKSLLWVAKCLLGETVIPPWIRPLLRLPRHVLVIFFLLYLPSHFTLDWQTVVFYLIGAETLEVATSWYKRRKLRREAAQTEANSALKPGYEQRAEE